MGALASTNPTLLDVARSLDPQGKVSSVAEVLSKHNEVLDDIPWFEGNLPTGHQVTLRSGLPTPTWRLFNQGATRIKSTTRQVSEVCGMLENYLEIDKDLAMLNGNTKAFQMSQANGIMEAFNQAFKTALIYGDVTADPEQFTGIAPRYYSTTQASYASQIISAGESSTLTSVYLVGWGAGKVYCTYPKGAMGGLQIQDLGEQTVYDSSLNPYQAYRTHFQWKPGLVVEDGRYVSRLANINIATLETASDSSDTSINLLKFMSMQLDKLYSLTDVRPVFYMNPRVLSMLRVKALFKTNLHLQLEELKGADGIPRQGKTLTFQGVPCRRIDEITVAETQIS